MTEQQAREQLELLLLLAQRSRSITIENYLKRNNQYDLDEIGCAVLEMEDAILFGRKRNVITDLAHVLAKKELQPLDYYNMVTRANHSTQLESYAAVANIPFPNLNAPVIFGEWGKESNIKQFTKTPGLEE